MRKTICDVLEGGQHAFEAREQALIELFSIKFRPAITDSNHYAVLLRLGSAWFVVCSASSEITPC